MDFISCYQFDKCVEKYNWNKKVRKLSCWEQFLTMSFWQITKEEIEEDWYMWRDEEIRVNIREWVEIISTVGKEYFRSWEKIGKNNNNSWEKMGTADLLSLQKETVNKKIRNENIRSLQDFQWFDSDWNWKINPEILKKVIKDEKWNYYKIVKMEYDFLVKYWLPFPEIHWIDRMKVNFNF